MSQIKESKSKHISLILIETSYDPKDLGTIQLVMDIAQDSVLIDRVELSKEKLEKIKEILEK